MKRDDCKLLTYRSPVERLADRFANLERHRQHIARELRLIEKLVTEYPELRARLPVGGKDKKLRLVVDNVAGPRPHGSVPRYRPRCNLDNDGPYAT